MQFLNSSFKVHYALLKKLIGNVQGNVHCPVHALYRAVQIYRDIWTVHCVQMCDTIGHTLCPGCMDTWTLTQYVQGMSDIPWRYIQ